MNYKYKYVSESHCHSDCSFDAKDSVEDMVKQAIKLKLYSITITDHCEVNGYANASESEFGDFSVRIPRSVRLQKDAQAKYGSKIEIMRGIELGQPLQDMKSADIALALDNFDFVLGSVHNIANEQDFYWLHYTEEYAYEMLGRYFAEILDTAKWNKFDSLSHLTYPLRYISGREKINIDLSCFSTVIDEIFQTLISNEKALEINTSGFRQELGDSMPNAPLLKRFKALGGKYVTVGSDAHCTSDLGKGIEKGLDILTECGFENYTIFKNHKPILIPIEKA